MKNDRKKYVTIYIKKELNNDITKESKRFQSGSKATNKDSRTSTKKPRHKQGQTDI